MGTKTRLKTLDLMARYSIASSLFLLRSLNSRPDVHKKIMPFSISYFSTCLFPLPAPSEIVNDGEAVKQVSATKLLHVVLLSPQIPGNTGAIARSCAAAGVGLHLVEPMAFQVDNNKLKRAGLYYWPFVVVKQHSSWAEFRNYFKQQGGEKRLLAFTKSGKHIHSEFSYKRGDWLVFGSETSGLTPEALLDCSSKPLGGGTIRIPMIETYVRCLNISVSVGIALYEASRQLNYEQFPQCPSEPPCSIDDNAQQSLITEDQFA